MNMKHRNCAVYTDQTGFQPTGKTNSILKHQKLKTLLKYRLHIPQLYWSHCIIQILLKV